MPEQQRPADVAALTEIAAWNRAAHEHGDRPPIIPCTGRPQAYCEAVCRLIGASAYPAVCENGVWLYDFAAHRWTISPDVSPSDLEAIAELSRWIERDLGPRGCFLQLGKSAAVTVFHDDVAWLERVVVPLLQTLIEEHRWPMRVSMTWTCINVDLRHVSKGHAIDRVTADHALAKDDLAGIGDTLGDLAIRERVSWFGCPSNAHDDLKPHADLIAGAPEARGVLELLDALRRDG